MIRRRAVDLASTVWMIRGVVLLLFGGSCHSFTTNLPPLRSIPHPSGPNKKFEENHRCIFAVFKANKQKDYDDETRRNNRRIVLTKLTMGIFGIAQMNFYSGTAFAAVGEGTEDLVSQMFNEDGSLKDEKMQTEAKMTTVRLQWDATATNLRTVAVNGVILQQQQEEQSQRAGDPSSTSRIQVSYDLPEKWKGSDYLDATADNQRACSKITVYQAPGIVTSAGSLSKATQIGIARALDVGDNDLRDVLNRADLIGGKSRVDANDNVRQVYYEFDMAIAPKSCSGSAQEDLRLGFCPYESIYLLSATVWNDRLYVFCLEADKLQWKRANADLRRVRNSFTVRNIA